MQYGEIIGMRNWILMDFFICVIDKTESNAKNNKSPFITKFTKKDHEGKDTKVRRKEKKARIFVLH
jgi:hypothetical protein